MSDKPLDIESDATELENAQTDSNGFEDKDAVSAEDLARFGDDVSDNGDSDIESELGETVDAQAALEAQVTSLQEELLRAKADYVNYTRVAERNVQTAREQTTLSLARALVPVLDTFDLTMQQDPEKMNAQDLLKGVEMVRDQLIKSLSNFGLKKIEVEVGSELDPNHHTALMKQPSEEIESGHITAVLQAGYVVNDKPVRPAQVAVAE